MASAFATTQHESKMAIPLIYSYQKPNRNILVWVTCSAPNICEVPLSGFLYMHSLCLRTLTSQEGTYRRLKLLIWRKRQGMAIYVLTRLPKGNQKGVFKTGKQQKHCTARAVCCKQMPASPLDWASTAAELHFWHPTEQKLWSNHVAERYFYQTLLIEKARNVHLYMYPRL